MDLTIRDWMVVVGVVLIVAVGLDAWRRVRRERRPKVKVKLAQAGATGADRDNDLNWLKELPNGGARVVDRRDLINATNKSDAAKREKAAAATAAAAAKTLRPKPRAASGPTPAVTAAAQSEELISGMSGDDSAQEPATLDWLDNMDPVGQDSPPPLQRPAVETGRLPRVSCLHHAIGAG